MLFWEIADVCVRVCVRGVICAYALSFFTHYIKVAKSRKFVFCFVQSSKWKLMKELFVNFSTQSKKLRFSDFIISNELMTFNNQPWIYESKNFLTKFTSSFWYALKKLILFEDQNRPK